MASPLTPDQTGSYLPPWYALPRAVPAGAHIAVLGAGLAGLLMAHRLRRDGFKVTLIDRRKSPMNEASGNPAAILEPVINRGHTPASRFYQQALVQALRFYSTLEPDIFIPCGLERRPSDAKDKHRLDAFFQAGQLPDDFIDQKEDGTLIFPSCGYLYPARLRETLMPQLEFHGEENIDRLIRNSRGWDLLDQAGKVRFTATAVVLTAPELVRLLPQSQGLPLQRVRGQISYFPATQNAPNRVISAQSYLTPPIVLPKEFLDPDQIDGSVHIAGASFERLPDKADITSQVTMQKVTMQEHDQNRKATARLLPDLANQPVLGGRAGIRYFTPDRLPLVGPVPVDDQYRAAYAGLHHGPRHRSFPPAAYHSHLYIFSGLGARGFLTAPLLSDYLAALIGGRPLPVPRPVIEALHPARFLIRNLKRHRQNR